MWSALMVDLAVPVKCHTIVLLLQAHLEIGQRAHSQRNLLLLQVLEELSILDTMDSMVNALGFQASERLPYVVRRPFFTYRINLK